MTEENTHGSWAGQFDAYLDGELGSGEMQSLDGHLRQCPGCTAEVLRRLQWKRVVHSAGQRYSPDVALRERIQKSIAPKKTAWWHWRPVFAATAAVLLLFAAGRIVQQEIVQPKQQVRQENKVQENQVLDELADLHVATLASANPVDVISSDRHNVKPWFAGKIPFTFNLPDLQGSQFELIGGRVSYLEQSPGAQLLFRVRKHQVSAFIFQARTVPSGFERPEEMDAQSFHLESWQRDGLQYFIISDVASDDLRALKELLKK
jgi:anti-sigma factor RsiW